MPTRGRVSQEELHLSVTRPRFGRLTIPNSHLVLLRIIDDRDQEGRECAKEGVIGTRKLVHQLLERSHLIHFVLDFYTTRIVSCAPLTSSRHPGTLTKNLQEVEVQLPCQNRRWQFTQVELKQGGHRVDIVVLLPFQEVHVALGIEALP